MTEKLRVHIRIVKLFGSGHQSLKSYIYARIENTKKLWNKPVYTCSQMWWVYLFQDRCIPSWTWQEKMFTDLSHKNRFDFTFSYLNIYFSQKSTGFQLYLVHIIMILSTSFLFFFTQCISDQIRDFFCKIQFRIKLEICWRNQKMDWNPQPL